MQHIEQVCHHVCSLTEISTAGQNPLPVQLILPQQSELKPLLTYCVMPQDPQNLAGVHALLVGHHASNVDVASALTTMLAKYTRRYARLGHLFRSP